MLIFEADEVLWLGAQFEPCAAVTSPSSSTKSSATSTGSSSPICQDEDLIYVEAVPEPADNSASSTGSTCSTCETGGQQSMSMLASAETQQFELETLLMHLQDFRGNGQMDKAINDGNALAAAVELSAAADQALEMVRAGRDIDMADLMVDSTEYLR